MLDRPYWTQQADYERASDLDTAEPGVIAAYKRAALASCDEKGFNRKLAENVWEFNIDREESGTYPEYLRWITTRLDHARRHN